MPSAGYYRYPTISGNRVAFVSEDDLWVVEDTGGKAIRISGGTGAVTRPAFSPDGKLLALSSQQEGHLEVYLMPASGGVLQRLTYLGGQSLVSGWTQHGEVVFASDAELPSRAPLELWACSPQGQPRRLRLGPALHYAESKRGAVVIGRNGLDPAHWKRYRGGRAGDLWIDPRGKGNFRRLLSLPGNLSRPLWIEQRLYFVSDHEGVGNLYSCSTTGRDLKRHTHHDDFYVRHPSSDGQRIVYQAGADLYVYDPRQESARKLDIEYLGPRTQRGRRFVSAESYLEGYQLAPGGKELCIWARGRCFAGANWQGALRSVGERDGARRRSACWLSDAKRIAVVCDRDGVEHIEVHGGSEVVRVSDGERLGRVVQLKASPKGDALVVTNHRQELLHIDLKKRSIRRLDSSAFGWISGARFSPDGRYIAYSFPLDSRRAELRLCELPRGRPRAVTKPLLRDFAPCFDPEGKYLFFLSFRQFSPVYDDLHFNLGFPHGRKPYVIMLQKQLSPPFDTGHASAQLLGKERTTTKGTSKRTAETARKDTSKHANQHTSQAASAGSTPGTASVGEVRIDFDGIVDRVLPVPVDDGCYEQLEVLSNKLLLRKRPILRVTEPRRYTSSAPSARSCLESFDFETRRVETLANSISSFQLCQKREKVALRIGNRIRILGAGDKADDALAREGPGKRSGWVDLKRTNLEIEPAVEWHQMFAEAWRLQRENFWSEDMSGIDWDAVRKRYAPLVERVNTRGELSDVLWEMQGELGTSHAYEMGGDYRPSPGYWVGKLAADFEYSERTGRYHFRRIIEGDGWKPDAGSPLARHDLGISVGDTLLQVDQQQLGPTRSPGAALVNCVRRPVQLVVGDKKGKSPRTISVTPLASDKAARYRQWVEDNRQHVHDKSKGQVGYLHVPDMSAGGYAEFYRGYLSELDRSGLIVDVRFNGGGHVSSLLLQKLASRRIAWCQARWTPGRPYPPESPAGPLVALTNEYAGSDGDIFCQGFKLMQLGPLIGTRTWGGVIGILPRHPLADGTVTTQPEYSYWFEDVGWNVENYGSEPDIVVEHRPQDHARGTDPQLDRAITECLKRVRSAQPHRPERTPRPVRRPPLLPKP